MRVPVPVKVVVQFGKEKNCHSNLLDTAIQEKLGTGKQGGKTEQQPTQPGGHLGNRYGSGNRVS